MRWLRNLKTRSIRKGNRTDDKFLVHIRRVNLDTLWIREKGTVYGHVTNYRKHVYVDADLGLESSFHSEGP